MLITFRNLLKLIHGLGFGSRLNLGFDQLVYFFGIQKYVFWVLNKVKNGRVPLGIVLQKVGLFLVVLDFTIVTDG